MILRKMCFFGHIIRKGGMERCIIEGNVEGIRRRGRPLTLWASDIVKNGFEEVRLMQFIRLLTEKGGWCVLEIAIAVH